MPYRVAPLRCASLLCLLLPSLLQAQFPVSRELTHEETVEQERAITLRRLGVSQWHQKGHRGKGIKVAILDSGFRGYKAHLGKALPNRVSTRSFRRDGNLEAKASQHGILCAEVIHAVAPEAELLFANWEPNHPVQFLKAVEWAKKSGAKIISCSIIMPTWSDAEGGGPIHQELSRIIGNGTKADDVLFVACAGNTAERHWGGSFQPAIQGYHAWSGSSIDNQILPWGNGHVSVELCGANGISLELLVYDATNGQLLGRSTADHTSTHRCAVVRFLPLSGHSYLARARKVKGEKGHFHLFILGGGLRDHTARGSIPFPGDGKHVLSVGAVDERGARLTYSSCGPCASLAKPNLVAVVPFQSYWRMRPFTGTSAAAPQAAGMAALLWSRSPKASAKKIKAKLHRSASDLGPEGFDGETGYGLLQAPRPVAASAISRGK